MGLVDKGGHRTGDRNVRVGRKNKMEKDIVNRERLYDILNTYITNNKQRRTILTFSGS